MDSFSFSFSSSSISSGTSSAPPPAPPSPEAATSPKRTRRGCVCQPCKDLRKKCDGQVPCSRCFTRGETCVPQKKHRRQPFDAYAYYYGGGAAPAAEALVAAASSASLQQTAVVELAFQRASPRPLVELLGQCFLRQATAPGARREVVVDCMRQWYLRGVACGGDASWGVLSRCMEALDVTPAELEDPRWMALDAAPQQQRLELLQRFGSYAANGPTLLAETFGPSEVGGAAALSVHLPCPDGVGPHVVVSNSAFMQRFFALQELHRAFLDKRALHFALSALVIAPEDRELFFSSFFKVLFSATPTRLVQLGKGIDRDGKVKLFIGEMRPARINADGTPCGVATRFEPAPPSRHLTTAPGKAHNHIEDFRERQHGGLAPGALAAVAAVQVPPAGAGPAGGAPSVSWLRELQQQQGQAIPTPAAAAAAAAVGILPTVRGMVALPLPPLQAHASPPSAPPLSPMAPALATLGLSPAAEEALPAAALPYSPFLLSKGGGGGQSPAPLAHLSLDALPDLDLEFLDAALGGEECD